MAFIVYHYKLNTSFWCPQSSLRSIRDSKKGVNSSYGTLPSHLSEGLTLIIYFTTVMRVLQVKYLIICWLNSKYQ